MNTPAFKLPFRPANTPLDAPSARPCQNSLVALRIDHQDTLGRPVALASAALETLGGRYFRPDLSSTEQEVYDQLPPASSMAYQSSTRIPGQHLIKLKSDVGDQTFSPGDPLRKPLRIGLHQTEQRMTAIHLPPPVIMNLREPITPEGDRLTEAQLSCFKANGNNALIFIHGYNVPLGGHGQFLKSLDYGAYPHISQHPKRTDPDQPVAIEGTFFSETATVFENPDHFLKDSLHRFRDDRLGGSGAHGWGAAMEYWLNRAAGFDGEDWMPYSRIIQIAWPGDDSVLDFMQAELAAMSSGRRLVTLIQQLAKAGISINLVTHSLGARVGLSALNILGGFGQKDCVDNVFLWQPAVADNALSADADQPSDPIGMEIFPKASIAAKKITVLHSKGDEILGHWLHDGAYPKKWWAFPPLIDNGLRPSMKKRFDTYATVWGKKQVMRRGERIDVPDLQLDLPRLRADLMREARELGPEVTRCFNAGKSLPQYTLLAPLQHYGVVSEQRVDWFIEKLDALQKMNWLPGVNPRPALGYVGLENTVHSDDPQLFDTSVQGMYYDLRLDEVDQSAWLFGHSDMKIPTPKILEKSYFEGIVENLRENSTFGQY